MRRLHSCFAAPLIVGGLMSLMGCRGAGTRPDSSPSPLTEVRAAQLDSATIDRLCVDPARVRTGAVSCVLKDQSQPPTFAPKRPESP